VTNVLQGQDIRYIGQSPVKIGNESLVPRLIFSRQIRSALNDDLNLSLWSKGNPLPLATKYSVERIGTSTSDRVEFNRILRSQMGVHPMHYFGCGTGTEETSGPFVGIDFQPLQPED
jgi:hypothetical protein